MSTKDTGKVRFVDCLLEPRLQKAHNKFLTLIDQEIDWRPINNYLRRKYRCRHDVVGAPAYDPVLLFRILLLQTWYKLSDCEVEERVNDSLSFSRFLGLSLESQCPDHSTISRFRSRLIELDMMDRLLEKLNKAMSKHRLSIKEGCIIDASIVTTPFDPKKGRPKLSEMADDREDNLSEELKTKELERHKTGKEFSVGTDLEAHYVKKNGKAYFGYKKHVLTDMDGLVIALRTEPANVPDPYQFIPVLDKVELPNRTPIYADKGYFGKAYGSYLKARNLKDRRMIKGRANAPLSVRQEVFNHLIAKVRYPVERTFGSIKRWFRGGRARYKGLKKVALQNVIEAMAYNLYRLPALVVRSRIS